MPIRTRRAAAPLLSWSSSTACSARRRGRQERRQVGDVVGARRRSPPRRAAERRARSAGARSRAAPVASARGQRVTGDGDARSRRGSIVIIERSPSASSTCTSRTIASRPETRTEATWPRRRRSRGTSSSVQRAALPETVALEQRARASRGCRSACRGSPRRSRRPRAPRRAASCGCGRRRLIVSVLPATASLSCAASASRARRCRAPGTRAGRATRACGRASRRGASRRRSPRRTSRARAAP